MRASSLITDDRGIAIPLFAVMAFTLILMTLSGLDLMRLQLVRSRVQAAMDAAILAAGGRLDGDSLQTDVESFFWANIDPNLMGSTVSDLLVSDPQGTKMTGQTVTLTAAVDIPLMVGGFMEATSWSFNVRAKAERQATKVELVLAMDNTGSMSSDGKLAAMKSAAKTLINALVGKADSVAGLAFATVPFTTSVRLPENGGGFTPTQWLDVPANAVVIKRNGTDGYGSPVTYKISGTNTNLPMRDDDFNAASDWHGCIMENADNSTDHLTDSPPGTGRLVQIIEDMDVCLKLDNKNKCTSHAVRPVYDPTRCDIKRATFLDPSASAARTAIDGMTANGNTAVFTGMLWAWRMLSPTWDATYDWGNATYPQAVDPDLVKAVVLLTDGKNETKSGIPTALGRDPSNAELDTALTKVCASAKAAGITIYAITFGSGAASGTIADRMKGCATNDSYYFHAPTSASLTEAFERIGGSLSRLSLIE